MKRDSKRQQEDQHIYIYGERKWVAAGFENRLYYLWWYEFTKLLPFILDCLYKWWCRHPYLVSPNSRGRKVQYGSFYV